MKKLSAIYIRIMESTDEIEQLKTLKEDGKLADWIEKMDIDLMRLLEKQKVNSTARNLDVIFL